MARRGENIYKRKDGRWEGRYKCGFTNNGKVKYRSVYGHSYAEVRAKLVPLKVAAPIMTASCHLTVNTLFDEWLSAVKLRVKPSTYANYQMKVEKHILPVFGGLRYETLTVQMLHAFIDDKLTSGSPRSTLPILSLFSKLWRSILPRYIVQGTFLKMF